MSQMIKLAGHSVRTHALHRRPVRSDDGSERIQIEVSVMIRGKAAQRAFTEVVRPNELQLEIDPDPPFQTEVIDRSMATSGEGPHAIYRFDISLRETEAVATERRSREVAEKGAAAKPAAAPTEPDSESDDIADVQLSGSDSMWATALRQMTGSKLEMPLVEPEPEPLVPAELAGVEAVLVGLRNEALIMALEQAGLIDRTHLDAQFMSLIRQRFVDEATPVVGERAARQALRDVLPE